MRITIRNAINGFIVVVVDDTDTTTAARAAVAITVAYGVVEFLIVFTASSDPHVTSTTLTYSSSTVFDSEASIRTISPALSSFFLKLHITKKLQNHCVSTWNTHITF